MKRTLVFLPFFLVAICSYAQDTLTRYLTDAWKETSRDSAFFIEKKIKVGGNWAVSNYYKTGVLRMKGVFMDDSLAKPNGVVEWYLETGKMIQSLTFKDGKTEGPGTRYFESGKKRAEGTYKMDKLDGDWTGYFESGKIAAKAHYENGEQKAASFYNEDGSANKSIKIFYRIAAFPGGTDALIKYLSHALQYPPSAQKKEIEGTVVVEFIVRPDGSIYKVKVVKSVEPSLDREALRVIREMPLWTPGLNGGTYAEYSMRQPVTFKLTTK